jgi:hypothetical protein
LADEDSRIMVGEVMDRVVHAEELDKRTFFLCGVAYGTKDTEKVNTRHSIFVAQLLHCASEDLRNREGRCYGRREADNLLQGLKHVLKCGL